MFAAFSASDPLLHICLNSSSCHNVLILLSLSGVTTLSLLFDVCAACMLAHRCLRMKWWAAVTVVAIPSQKALLMCPYVSSGKIPVLAPRYSCALLHNLQLTSDRCLIFASHLATGMIPAIDIISRLLCLQVTRGSFRYFPKNALLSFCLNMKSAVHVPYAGWLILSGSALARTHDFKNFLSSIQVFCCKTFTMFWYDSSYRCLCVQSSMSSPLLVSGWCVCVCLYTRVHTNKLLGYLMWAQVWDGHQESQKYPDQLKRSIHVDSIGVHSTFVYIHAVLRVLMIWANCFFLLTSLFLWEK